MGAGECAPAGLCGLDELEHHRECRVGAASTRVTFVRSLSVENVFGGRRGLLAPREQVLGQLTGLTPSKSERRYP